MISNIFISLRVLIKGRFFYLLVMSSLVVLLFSFGASLFSGRQSLTVAVDVGFSMSRLILPMFILVGLIENNIKEFSGRYYLNSMAYPQGRISFIFARFLSVNVVSFFSLFFIFFFLHIVSLYLVLRLEGDHRVDLMGGYWLAVLFLYFDLVVLSAFGLLMSVLATRSIFLVVAFLGFMVASRSYSYVAYLLSMDSSVGLGSLEWLRYAFPDLSVFDIREVSIYGRSFKELGFSELGYWSALLYTLACVGGAVFVFSKKKMV